MYLSHHPIPLGLPLSDGSGGCFTLIVLPSLCLPLCGGVELYFLLPESFARLGQWSLADAWRTATNKSTAGLCSLTTSGGLPCLWSLPFASCGRIPHRHLVSESVGPCACLLVSSCRIV